MWLAFDRATAAMPLGAVPPWPAGAAATLVAMRRAVPATLTWAAAATLALRSRADVALRLTTLWVVIKAVAWWGKWEVVLRLVTQVLLLTLQGVDLAIGVNHLLGQGGESNHEQPFQLCSRCARLGYVLVDIWLPAWNLAVAGVALEGVASIAQCINGAAPVGHVGDHLLQVGNVAELDLALCTGQVWCQRRLMIRFPPLVTNSVRPGVGA